MTSVELTCLKCRRGFKNVTIEAGEVRCPHCGRVIFQYKQPNDESMTPEQFAALLTGPRGKEAVQQTAKFFLGKRDALLIAGALVVYLWPQLAKTFEVEAQSQ